MHAITHVERSSADIRLQSHWSHPRKANWRKSSSLVNGILTWTGGSRRLAYNMHVARLVQTSTVRGPVSVTNDTKMLVRYITSGNADRVLNQRGIYNLHLDVASLYISFYCVLLLT